MSASASHYNISAGASESGGSPGSNNDPDDKKLFRGSGKRNRVHFACTECYRRKQKCNRETPCQHCIARKIPERCRTFQPGQDANDIGSRLARVEKLLEEYLPTLMDRVESMIAISAHPAAGVLTMSPPSFHPSASARDSNFSNRRSIAPPAQEESDDEPEQAGRLSPKSGLLLGGMRLGTILDGLPGKVPKTAVYREPFRTVEGAPDVDEIMSEYGAPVGCSAELLGALPSRSLCNALLQHFFDQINWMRQPLPQQSLRESFYNFWNSGPKLTADNINIFALLCGLCAISSLSVEESTFPGAPRSRILAARRYHYAARRALLTSSMMGREDLDQVVAWNLSCRFLLLDRRIGEAYTCGACAVKAGHSIGLHRDGSKLGLNPVETEARRRVWAAVYFFDRSLCMNTGRPSVIDDKICDTLSLSESVDEDVFPLPMHPPKMPEGVKPPTPFSYAIHRHQIALLEGRILTSFQSLDTPTHVSDVLAIDKEIRSLQDNLPFYFKARRTPDDGVVCEKSLDSHYGFLNVHRFLIHTEINSVRMALHRPFLLRSANDHGAKYMMCRQACLDAALCDLQLRGDFIKDLKISKDSIPRVFRVHIGTYKWFHSLLICGIVLLMDPHASNAEQLRNHLQDFIDTHHRRPAEHRDEMKEREANVIQLFLTKMEEMQKVSASKGASKRQREKQLSIDASNQKRVKSEDLVDGGRRVASGKLPSRRGTEDDGDEHATAGLLLGLGQQGRQATTSYADLAGPVLSSTKSPSGVAYTSSSGDWPRGYPGASMSGLSASGSPVGTPGLATAGGSTTVSPGAPTNGSTGDDAQQIFDTWYKAEFAAASMPSYDAPYPGGGFSGTPFSSGMTAATALGPGGTNASYGSQQSLDQAQASGLPSAQQNLDGSIPSATTGWNLGNMSTSGFNNLNQPGPAHNVGGYNAPNPATGSLSTCQTSSSFPAPSVPAAPSNGQTPKGIWQPSSGEANNQSFDPSFWQALIDKIVT